MTVKSFVLLFAFTTLALSLAPARAQATTTWWQCEARVINRDYTCNGNEDHTSDIKFTFARAADDAVRNCEYAHHSENCGYFNCVQCEWSIVFKQWNDGCPFGRAPFSSLESPEIHEALAVLEKGAHKRSGSPGHRMQSRISDRSFFGNGSEAPPEVPMYEGIDAHPSNPAI